MRPGSRSRDRARTGAGRLRDGRWLCVAQSLPLYEDGPGNGQWNLGQYLVARGSDLPLRDLEVEVLPAVDANERPKGMAEVVMIPVVAALINAIFDATGHRFRSLPVTQQMLKGVLT